MKRLSAGYLCGFASFALKLLTLRPSFAALASPSTGSLGDEVFLIGEEFYNGNRFPV
jgi:hypothetical protein